MSRPSAASSRSPGASAGGDPHRVVVVGGGFGGLAVARGLADVPGVEVTVLDKRNFHLFQPLLYQVATGALSPGDVAAPLREALRRTRNITVLLGDVVDVDVDSREVILDPPVPDANEEEAAQVEAGPGTTDAGSRRVPFDTLVFAAGLVTNYFGNDGWDRWAPGLKSVEDATEVRSRLLLAFEEAERTTDPARRRASLTFVVVGAGPTGVEMAGAIAEIAADTMPVEFRRIAREKVRVVLLDAGARVLPSFPPPLSEAARRDLEALGVEVRISTPVREVGDGFVDVETAGVRERIEARLVVWAAGVRGTELAARIAKATGALLTRQGTLGVEPDCSLPGHPSLFAIGDAAAFVPVPGQAPLPGVAQVAIQQGAYVAGVIRARLQGRESGPFGYRDKGSMATIGRARAVADLHVLKLTGAVAWLAWLFVHLLFLVGYENRILVLTQWAWYYVWRRRSARLITAWHRSGRPPTLA